MRFLVLLFSLLVTVAFGDDWIAFETKTFHSPDGKRKLTIRQSRDFVFGEVKGMLPQLPFDVYVFNRNRGAVLFEQYEQLGHGDTLALLKADGTIRWRVSLGDLFGRKVIATFMRTTSSIWWHRAWWVDEPRNKVVLLSKGGHVRDVDLATGRIAPGGPKSILAAIALPHARERALELSAELHLKGALPLATPLIADKQLPVSVRLRAAVAVQTVGGPAVRNELFVEAMGKRESLKNRRYAISRLAVMLPEGGLDLLERAALRRETAFDAIRALHGIRAAGTLAAVIASGDTEKAMREYASEMLGKLPAEDVGKAIASEFADADADVAGALLRAGIQAGVSRLSALVAQQEETLIRALDHGHAPIEWTADHFARHPTTTAVDALLKTLGKNQSKPQRASKLIAALRACTGLDFGTSFQAWRKGLGR